MTNKAIFAKVINKLPLLEKDRVHLKEERGFTDEIIDTYKFRSCGNFLAKEDWYQKLPEEFRKSLYYDNIIIPYFDLEGQVIHIRPHKFGIANLPIQVYIPYTFIGKDLPVLVIAESEYKALASCVLGIPAVGIPGIKSFSKNHLIRLIEIVNALGPKTLSICFDNEIKDNPLFDNYKPDFRKRYDTMIYAYIMAYQFNNRVNIPTTVAVLKDEWMVNGKVDIDNLLTSKIDPKEYKEVIEKGLSPAAYRYSWKLNNVHLSFVERWIDKYFYEGPISEMHNCYFYKTSKDNKRISNFIIRVIHTLYDSEGKATRVCKLLSRYGDSKIATINADMMVSRLAFQKFCLEMGDYEFSGTDSQLQAIWKFVFMNQDGRGINKLDYYGYNESCGTWFFGHGAYLHEKFYPKTDDEVMWVEDLGYKPIQDLHDLTAPTLMQDMHEEVTIKKIFDNMAGILDEGHAKLLLGWTLGNFFMPEILAEYGIYPFLFLYGKQAGGKSTIAGWVTSFFGFVQKGVNFHNSSVVGISRTTSQMSMVPVWLEEYRNKDPDIGKKNNFLRGIYDRSTIVKGTKRENEIKTYTARSTLIISGEEHPRDAALNSRCLLFPIYRSDKKQKISKEFVWLEKYKSYFCSIGHHLLTNKKEYWPKIKDRINTYMESFDDIKSSTISSRNRVQMSIVSSIVDVLVGECNVFSLFVGDKAKQMEERVKYDQALYVFYDDLYTMYQSGKLKTKIFEVKGNEAYLWFSVAYAEWEVFYRGLRNDIPASKAALMEHLKREQYFMGRKQVRIGDKSIGAYVFDFVHPSFPESLKDLANDQYQEVVEEDKPVQSMFGYND